ncbi:MAG: hypothetical protein ACYDCD_00555 [Candidatus Acidiferrales bacterium]
MFNRFLTTLGLAIALAGGMLLMPKPAAAQQGQDYYTYVSEWAVPRTQWAAFDKEDSASISRMQKFVADGTLVDWGNVSVRVHQEDGYTHAEWFTANSRAALLKVLETDWATAANPAFSSATKHFDLFLHTLAHGGKTSSGATGYIRVASWQAKPGQESALEATFMKYIKPTLDADVANGTLLMYNFDTEDIHTDPPGAYDLAMVFPNGEAMDKFFADLATNQKENPSTGELLDSLTVSKDHRDSFGRVTAYQHK